MVLLATWPLQALLASSTKQLAPHELYINELLTYFWLPLTTSLVALPPCAYKQLAKTIENIHAILVETMCINNKTTYCNMLNFHSV